MGMTIDKATKILENYYDTFCGYSNGGFFGAIYTAISTMRKYEKITEIVTKWHNDLSFKTSMAMTEIEEVIEDGKID